MFVRTKKIKRYRYAYLVENTWKKNSSRQKVSKYLGRVYDYADGALPTVHTLDGLSYRESVRHLVEVHLKLLGFSEQQTDSGVVLQKEDLVFYPSTLTFKQKNGKPFVVKNYDGYLCDYTVKKLADFTKIGDEESTGYKLAKACVEAGLNVPKEAFVEMFEKICPIAETVRKMQS